MLQAKLRRSLLSPYIISNRKKGAKILVYMTVYMYMYMCVHQLSTPVGH